MCSSDLEPVAAAGVITGRIFNPASGEYIRNAEVRIAGGPATAAQDGGVYRLSGVAPRRSHGHR